MKDTTIPPAKRPMRSKGTRFDAVPYLLILPVGFLMAFLFFYPIVRAAQISLFRAPAANLKLGAKYIGLGNYVTLLKSPSFWKSLRLTIVYALVTLAGSYVLGLITALALNESFTGRGLARSIVILPWAIPGLAAIMTWTWMYDVQYGVLNFLFMKIGLISEPISYLTNPAIALLAIIAVEVWKSFPFSGLMLLAGLQSIPNALYEAASIDGAGVLQKFVHITLPGLQSISSILILLMIIWRLGSFMFIFVFTTGGPARSTETLGIGLYLRAFLFNEFGAACAIGMMLLVLSLVLSLIYFRIVMSQEA